MKFKSPIGLPDRTSVYNLPSEKIVVHIGCTCNEVLLQSRDAVEVGSGRFDVLKSPKAEIVCFETN